MISQIFRRGFLAIVTAMLVLAGLPDFVLAQDAKPRQQGEGRGQRGANVARMVEGVRTLLVELKLSDEQTAKTDEILQTAREEMRNILQDTSTEQRDKARAVREKWIDTQSQVRQVLDDEQKKAFDAGLEKLRTEATQGRGGMQLVQRLERALAAVELTEEQKPKVQLVIDETTKQLEALRDEARDAGDPSSVRQKAQQLRDETMDKLREVLTLEQMGKLREAMNADRPRQQEDQKDRPQVQGDSPPATDNTATRSEAGTAGLSASGANVSTRDFQPVAIGEKVSPFSLMTLAGKPFNEGSLRGKPTAIWFGSYSSPATRDGQAKLEELSETFRSRVQFVLVYTAEMHPADAEQPARNARDKISIPSHKSAEDRSAAARVARDALKIKFDVAPDAMDDRLQRTLGVGANGAAVIHADGTLAFRQDWADAYAIERALSRALAAK